jgi:hypothetical protein
MAEDAFLIGRDTLRNMLRVLRKVEGMALRGNVDFTNSPTGISGFVKGAVEGAGADPSPPEIRRVVVAEPNVATAPVLQLVQDIDANGDPTGDAFPVVSLCKMATDDEFYIFRPASGLIDGPTYTDGDSNVIAVVWRDVRMPGLYDVVLTASGGATASNPADRTYDVKLQGYPTTISSSAQSPYRPYKGRITSDATAGQAYIDSDGVPTLRFAYEGLTAAAC